MDISYLLFLQNIREATGGAFDAIFEYITKLGETSILLFLIGLIYWCYDKKKGIFLMFTLYWGRIINGFIKITACVYRPWIRDARITPVPAAQADATGYSFPSGHTGNAVSVWGGLAVDTDEKSKVPKAFKILLVILIILIAFSRNYLGVHTPQDVIVAFVIGIISIFAVAKLMPVIENNKNADIWALLAGVGACVLLMAYAALKSYPADYAADGTIIVEGSKMAVDSFKTAGGAMGVFIGWFIERRFIKFSTDIKTAEKVLRAVFCIFTYTMVDHFAGTGADMLVSLGIGSGFAKAAMQFVCMFWFVALAPAITKIFSLFFKDKN